MGQGKIKKPWGSLPIAMGAAIIILAGAFSAPSQNLKRNAVTDLSDQGGKASFTLKRGDNEFGVLGGTSLNTPTLFGRVVDARLTVVALRYGRIFGTKRGVAFEYTIDALPAVVVSQPEFVVQQVDSAVSVQRKHRSVYGGGISPVGFKFIFRRRSRVQPFANLSGGILYFARQVPAPSTSQFNFTFNLSGGAQLLAGAQGGRGGL